MTFLRRAHLEPVIRPASELHLTVLVVEGEPGDVDGAGGEEDAGRDVGAEAVGGDHHIRWVGSVKSLAGANKKQQCCKKCVFLMCGQSPVVHQNIGFPKLTRRHLMPKTLIILVKLVQLKWQ